MVKAEGISTKKRPRFRYWRGHGIHSPFVYSLVREVFMRRKLTEGGFALYDILRSKGIRKKTAVQLDNLYRFCGFASFSMDGSGHGQENHFHIYTAPPEERPAPAEGAVCIICRRDKHLKRICRKMVDNHTGVSIDRKGYYLYFYAPSYFAQHYKL